MLPGREMKYIRHIAAESLRMYPQPPLLIRRALEDDELPAGKGGPNGLRPKINRGVDIFLAVYSLHRSKEFWANPDTFDPDRFDRPFENKGIEGWAGFDPSMSEGQLYPNEINADFAFLPFGGEERARQRARPTDRIGCLKFPPISFFLEQEHAA